MSLVKKHCPTYLSVCHGQLCSGFLGNLAGCTVFHALACVGADDGDTLRLAFEDSRWPQAEELSHVGLRKNALGLLPSAMAAARGNIALCARLTRVEDHLRSEAAAAALRNSLNSLQRRLETAAGKEFNFMFKMMTCGSADQFSIPTSHASIAMIETAQLGYSNVVRKLVELGVRPSVQGKRKETALHVFAHTGNLEMVRFLLDRGAEVDARDKELCTPLHWAAWAGKLDTARELLVRRADVNAVDRDGRTVLFGAAGGGYTEVVRLLLSRNADRSIRGGRSGETPLERAMKRRHGAVVELLSGK